MNVDFIYWTFSAAAQSISAFVAFLLTGYALVDTLMETARQRDDTLVEVHVALQERYHQQMTVLACLTGLGIVLSLTIVYFNRPTAPVPVWSQALVALIDLSSVIGGLLFVVSIVDPSKYKLAAVQELSETTSSSEQTTSAGNFFEAFIHLERVLRNYFAKREIPVPRGGPSPFQYSFKNMIEALRANEIIDNSFYYELRDINRYRNLVFHGHVNKAGLDMLWRTQKAASLIDKME
jgi:hypothetical protein